MYVIGYRGNRLPTKKAIKAIVTAGNGERLDLIDTAFVGGANLCADEVAEGKVYAFVGPTEGERRYYGTVTRRNGRLVVA
jgi:hypothetical protein